VPASRAAASGESSSTTHRSDMPAQNNITSSTTPKTSDVPRSGWMNTRNQGIRITPEGRSRSIGRSIGKRLSTPASSRIAASLANSEGCTWKPPMLIQRWAPRAEVPTSLTAIRLTTMRP